MRAWVGLLAAAGLLLGESAEGATLFALVNTGEVFVSADQGVNWTARSTLAVHDAVALAAGANSLQLYLASTGGTVYRSDDAGTNWTAVGEVPASDVCDLTVRPDLSILLLTAGGAVYRSTDHGVNFTALGGPTGSNFVSLTRTAYGESLYALARTGETWESTDGGTSWIAKGSVAVSDAVELRWVTGSLYLLTASGDLIQSTNGGTSWLGIGTLSQVGMTSLANDQGTLIVTAGTGEVATSANGANWTWRGAINQMTVLGLGTDRPAPEDVVPPEDEMGLSASVPWPNPARRGQMISIALRLPKESSITVELLDASGRRVSGRAAETFPAGVHRLEWVPSRLSAGVYTIRIESSSGLAVSRRLVALR
jgi:hypothetical protein